MTFILNVPPSQVIKQAANDDGVEGGQKKSRDEYRKLKELEEARKAGSVEAMKDEEGKDINPHIPQYIMQVPWYYGETRPTLKHQKHHPERQREFARLSDWYKKGVKQATVPTKFRKGACENCGAMTHKKKDCFERPRKLGAKHTGANLAPDEPTQPDLEFSFEGKRDRWNGFDTEDYNEEMADTFAKVEEVKRNIKMQRLKEKLLSGEIDPEEKKQLEENVDDDDLNEEKYVEDMDMPGQKWEGKERMTVRNLRIREDTAKYLYNLDLESAYYDPKTRAMRGNPFAEEGKAPSEVPYAGDNFVRHSGETANMAKQQLFAWEMCHKGMELHLQSDPTRLELMKQEYHNRKDDFKQEIQQSILDKYGGEQYLKGPPKELLMAQSEQYVEYSRQGTILKGQEKTTVKSQYDEDIWTNNHTSVWGSFWKDVKWGYACCHSLVRESYCVGEKGKQIVSDSTPSIGPTTEQFDNIISIPEASASTCTSTGRNLDENESSGDDDEYEEVSIRSKTERTSKRKRKKKKDKKKHKHKKKRRRTKSTSEDSSSEEEDEKKKLEKALKKEEQRQKQVDRLMQMDERKRPYNSMVEIKAPTEEEMEAWRLKQMNAEDPMAQFLTR